MCGRAAAKSTVDSGHSPPYTNVQSCRRAPFKGWHRNGCAFRCSDLPSALLLLLLLLLPMHRCCYHLLLLLLLV